MQTTKAPNTQSRANAIPTLLRSLTALAMHPGVALTLFTLLALGLRLYRLSYRDYFDDEVITSFVARLTPIEIFRTITANDTHPPLYHILLHLWRAGFGESLIALRLFSVLTSTACVPLTYLLGRRLSTHSAGLSGAAIMAIAPFQIYHAQQARMYALLTLLTLISTLLFLRAWDHNRWYDWCWFGLSATAGMYTHIYFPLSLMAFNIWALYTVLAQRRIDWPRCIGLIAAQALAVLLFLPFLPAMLFTVRGVVRVFWIDSNTPFDWMFDLVSLANHATIGTLPENAAPTWFLLCTYLPAVAVLLLALIYSVREARRHPQERSAWVLLHLLIWTPIVIATIISLTVKPILLDRSLIGISSALFLLIGWMFARFWRQRVIQLVAISFVASCFAVLAHVFPAAPLQNNFVRAADYIASNAQPGDAITYVDWQSFDTAALAHPEQRDVYILPGPTLDTSYWLNRMQAMQLQRPHNVLSVPQFAPRFKRVWMVFSAYTYDLDFHRQVDKGWLDRHGHKAAQLDFDKVVILLYEVNP